MLVGLEIPLLMRILRDRFEFKDVVAHVLTFDYLGALGASLLFPIVLVPQLGLVRAADALRRSSTPPSRCGRTRLLRDVAGRAAGALAGVPASWRSRCSAPACAMADRILDLAEANLYADEVVLARTTPYQRIVMTAWKDDLRLFLNSHLQFSSRDEYRYHEALVHPGAGGAAERAARARPRRRRRAGAARDAALPAGRARHAGRSRSRDDAPVLDAPASCAGSIGGAFDDPRVHVVNADAFAWLDERRRAASTSPSSTFPDPSNFSLGKLYTTAFYRLLTRAPRARRHVRRAEHVAALRAPVVLVHRRDRSKQAGLVAAPYHVYVPSFGEWGFVLGRPVARTSRRRRCPPACAS